MKDGGSGIAPGRFHGHPAPENNASKLKTLHQNACCNAVPLLVSAAAIYFITRSVNTAQMATALQKLKWWNLPLMLSLFFFGQILRAWAWKIMLGSNFDLKTAFFTMNAGYLLNNILPFRLGEIGRGLLLTGQGKNRSSFMEVIASIMTERVLDVFLAATLMLLSLPLVIQSSSMRRIALLAFMLTLFGMVAAGFAQQGGNSSWDGPEPNCGYWISSRLLHRIDQILVGFSFFTLRLVTALGLLALSWLTAMGEIYVLQAALVPAGQVWWPVFVLSAGAFAMALPSAPAGLGVYEAAIVGAYALLGVEQSTSLVIAIIVHLVQTLLSSVLGIIGLSLMGKNLGELVRQARQRRAAETARAE